MTKVPMVYASFDASRSRNPAWTDLKYYFLLRAWLCRGPLAGTLIDVHRLAPVRKPDDLRVELARRLQESDVMLIILSERSRDSAGLMPWEIEHGAVACGLPLVCSYVGHTSVDERRGFTPWWPDALHRVMGRAEARAVHVPFRPNDLARSMNQPWWAGDR